MNLPMIGKRYRVEFPTMAFTLHFLTPTALEFTVDSSPDLPAGSTHVVDIVIEPLRDGVFMVSWQEASGNTVIHVEDFREHRVHAFLTLKDMTFVRQTAPLIEIAPSNV